MPGTSTSPNLRVTRGRSARYVGTTLAIAGIAYVAAGVAARLGREAWRFRRAARTLYRRWTAIPAIAGTGTLRIHSRIRDVMTNADPVVLVHGHGIGSSCFVPLAARLSAFAPVYAPDLPGHGPSDDDARPLGVEELARALGAWMDAMGLRRAVLVGHALGCEVALHAAAMRPDLASRLVLIGPASDACSRPQAPLVVMRGARDRIVSRRRAERLARATGAPDPVVVPGWGHAVHYEDPATVAALILGTGIPAERERRAQPPTPWIPAS